jgi:hypothetical protein
MLIRQGVYKKSNAGDVETRNGEGDFDVRNERV